MITWDTRRNFLNFARVCAKLVEEGDLDILLGCEVGGFRQGFRAANVNVGDLLKEPFGERNFEFVELDNNLAMWGFGGASQPSVVSLHGSPAVWPIPVGREIDAAVTRFDVNTSTNSKVHLVVGNTHIVCGRNAPSTATKNALSSF